MEMRELNLEEMNMINGGINNPAIPQGWDTMRESMWTAKSSGMSFEDFMRTTGLGEKYSNDPEMWIILKTAWDAL